MVSSTSPWLCKVTTANSTLPLPEYVKRLAPNHSLITRYPTFMNRNDCCSNLLDILSDGLVVVYLGRGRDDSEAGAVRADAPIPQNLPVFYYEVKVVDKGRDGYMSMGVMTIKSATDKLVGWDTESLGYHGDDGLLFRGNSGQGDPFGPKWGQDDIVGCGIDFVDRRAFFVKNGIIVNFCDFPKSGSSPLFPAVGLRTPNERLEINFMGPFEFDIMKHLDRRAYKLCTSIRSRPISPLQVQDLLLFYLLYNGYEETFYTVLTTLPDKQYLAQNEKIHKYFEEKRIQRELFRLIDSGQITHVRTLLEMSFPNVSRLTEVNFMLTGLELVEVAFLPGHQTVELIHKAAQFQALIHQGFPLKEHSKNPLSPYKKAAEVNIHDLNVT
jgi:hypothetical protein